MDREASAPSTGAGAVKLDFAGAASADTAEAFPAAISPRLPTADRMAVGIHATLGDQARAEVKLCVAPSGKVASVELEQSSSMVELDRAMLTDIAGWQFAAMPGPANVKACERFTISYRPL